MLSYSRYWKSGLFVVSFAFVSPVVNASDPDWAGYYGGLSLVQRAVDADWETTSYTDPGGVSQPFETSPDASMNTSSLVVGVFAGRNWLISPKLLVGVEARIGSGRNKQKYGTIPGADVFDSYVEVEAGNELSVFGRVGYLVEPNVHLYGNLGFTSLNVEATGVCLADDVFCNSATGVQSSSESKTLTGWAVGVGVETVMKEKWLLRAEYGIADYGKFSFEGISYSPDTFGFESDIDFTSSQLSVDVVYMF